MPSSTAFERWLAEQTRANREDLEAEWYRNAMGDACPACGEVAFPTSWRGEDPITARYACSPCGHEWVCGWARHFVENPF